MTSPDPSPSQALRRGERFEGPASFKDVTGTFAVNTTAAEPPCGWVGLGADLTNVDVAVTHRRNHVPTARIRAPAGSIDDIPAVAAGDPLTVAAEAFDADSGTANGEGISEVRFELWRGERTLGRFTDRSPEYSGTIDTTGFEQGYYILHITAVAVDGGREYDALPLRVTPPRWAGARPGARASASASGSSATGRGDGSLRGT